MNFKSLFSWAVLMLAFGVTPTLRAQDAASTMAQEKPLAPLFELKHSDLVTSIAIAPDGKTLAAATWKLENEKPVNTYWLWNLASGELIRSWPSGTGYVMFSPDGKTLAGVTREGLTLWNLQGEKQKVLGGHTNGVKAMAFSPDGQTLVTSAGRRHERQDGAELFLWDLASGTKREISISGPAGGEAVAFSPNGRWLAVPTSNLRFETPIEIGVWEVTSLQPVATLKSESIGGWINALAFAPDSQTLASAHLGREVALWDVPGNQLKTALLRYIEDSNGNSAKAVAFLADGQTLISAGVKWGAMGPGSELLVWNWRKGELEHSITLHEEFSISSFAAAAKAPVFASTYERSAVVQVWRLP